MSFVATTSIRKNALLLLGCAAFVAIGIWMVRSPLQDREIESLVGGWLSIMFFGFGGVVALAQIIVMRDRLTIDSYGITWTRRSDQTIPWSAIADIDVLTIGHQRLVGIYLSQPAGYPPRRRLLMWTAPLNKRIYGGDVYIPTILWNVSSKQVLAAVEQYWPPADR